jgi:cell wall-associated NlpC family hydrolase
MSDSDYKRIIYSPEVQVYIQTASGKIIDISDDIIEGSVVRRTETLSTASFVVQSRKKKNNSLLLENVLRPMDRIVVYLKKVKPILVFSGYLDLVPLFQAIPEPFVIEASCTLKRLEFTYWDPQLPHVYEVLAKYGFAPQSNGSGGVAFFTPPGRAATSRGARQTKEIQDTGFGAMLYFLLHDVGGWPTENIWIEPLPKEWIERASLLFQVKNDWEERFGIAQDVIKSILTSGGTGEGGTGDPDGIVLLDGDNIAAQIDLSIEKYKQGETDVTSADFIKYAKQVDVPVDPRFLAAIAGAETAYGTTGQGRAPGDGGYYNMYGLGESGRKMPSRAESIRQAAQQLGNRNKDYYLGKNPNQTIDGWITNWTNGNQEHKDNVERIWSEMATPSAPVQPNKPYSIQGQGIQATDFTSPTTRSTNPANDGSPNGNNSNKVLSVYLEARYAGIGGDAIPGYRNDPGKSGNDRELNIALLQKIEEQYNALPEDKKKNIEIKFIKESSSDSRPKGRVADVYLVIDHANTNNAKIGRPSQYSLTGDTEDNKTLGAGIGKAGPNRYSPANGGSSGFVMPESGEGGRNQINNDNNLIKNSSQLSSLLKFVFDSTGTKLTDISMTGSQSDNNLVNYYGFYFINSAACAIIELPSPVVTSSYNTDLVAKAIVNALVSYQTYKAAGKQLAPKKGTQHGKRKGTKAGDNLPASRLIKVCGETAQYNSNTERMKYNMRNRHLGFTLKKCREENYETDCSSFILNGMFEAGLISKPSSGFTGSLWSDSIKLEKTKENLKPGLLLIKGGANGEGAAGHVVLYIGDNTVVHSTSGGIEGPQFGSLGTFFDDPIYDLCQHEKIGTTDSPPSDFENPGGGEESSVDTFLQAKNVAFNVAFNFPGSLLESVLLTGERALENDVKLLESVGEICKASLRTFSSLPNGDFVAWYPDYFNLTGRNPWIVISPTEITSCTISLSDKQLVTHVYVLGNPFGFNADSGSQINLEWYEKLLGSGVVTLERPWVLDSFLRPFQTESELIRRTDAASNQTNLQGLPQVQQAYKKRPRAILEGTGAVLKFLERYGARPYFEKVPTIRHPVFEFFYAYHTFIQKWSEQFASKISMTFMPELFPGMIIEVRLNNNSEDKDTGSVTFYVKEVAHNFSYESGFSTEAVVVAPGTTKQGNNWSMVLVTPPTAAPRKRKTVVRKRKKK